jgi:hypothetical protein
MKLEGSCYCKRVRFSAVSHTPYPYMRCYCCMCRKTGGGGGYAINIMVDVGSMKVEGEQYVEAHENWADDDERPES